MKLIKEQQKQCGLQGMQHKKHFLLISSGPECAAPALTLRSPGEYEGTAVVLGSPLRLCFSRSAHQCFCGLPGDPYSVTTAGVATRTMIRREQLPVHNLGWGWGSCATSLKWLSPSCIIQQPDCHHPFYPPNGTSRRYCKCLPFLLPFSQRVQQFW